MAWRGASFDGRRPAEDGDVAVWKLHGSAAYTAPSPESPSARRAFEKLAREYRRARAQDPGHAAAMAEVEKAIAVPGHVSAGVRAVFERRLRDAVRHRICAAVTDERTAREALAITLNSVADFRQTMRLPGGHAGVSSATVSGPLEPQGDARPRRRPVAPRAGVRVAGRPVPAAIYLDRFEGEADRSLVVRLRELLS